MRPAERYAAALRDEIRRRVPAAVIWRITHAELDGDPDDRLLAACEDTLSRSISLVIDRLGSLASTKAWADLTTSDKALEADEAPSYEEAASDDDDDE